MVEPRCVHLIMEKHLMRHMKGTIDYGRSYESDQNIILQGHVDSFWDDSVRNMNITSGCYFSF